MTQQLFVLTCMRSYSSLFAGMIGQHPDVYGFLELNPFVANAVGGVLSMTDSLRPASLHGTLRTIAQIEYGEQTEENIERARSWLEARRDWSTKKLLEYLGERVGTKLIVEKSPSTVMFKASLERMYRDFPDAYFLHLTRHPRPTCLSIRNLIAEADKKKGTARADRTDPERMWLRAHQNILEFGKDLPPGQLMRIQGEMLLTDPKLYFGQIMEWLGLDFNDDIYNLMQHPEASPYARLGPSNALYGSDINYLNNPVFKQRPIPESHLEGPLEWLAQPEGSGFSRQTIKIARQLGYR